MLRTLLLAGVMAFGLCTTALADNIGKALPDVLLEDFTQSPATSLDELQGRAILIEFFAYW